MLLLFCAQRQTFIVDMLSDMRYDAINYIYVRPKADK